MFTLKINFIQLAKFSLIGLAINLSSIQNSLAQQSSTPTVTLTPTSTTPVAAKPSPWFYGGGIGASFGDVEYFEIVPMVGYKVNPKTSVGVSLLYRYSKDKRYQESSSTTDYGATLFARYSLTPSFYLQAEYEYIDYEYAIVNRITGSVVGTERDNFTSLLAGGGFLKPIGGNASLYITALYNFNYNDDNSPYSDPVSIRLGIGVGF